MKKWIFVVIIVLVAAVSSAATVGVMKFVENYKSGGPIIILSDKRCTDCDPQRFEGVLKQKFPNEKVAVLDYGDSKGKKLFEREKIDKLPAILLPKGLEKAEGFEQMKRFTKPGKDYVVLMTGGEFDPKAEICDNGVDDNGDALVDCADPTCKGNWVCMEKKDKPDIDVFVMSHCPFGTQMEKGLLPVWDLLGDKVSLNIRFCDYAMHGKKEVDEELRQHCIQKMGKKTYRKYLECFLKEGKEDSSCVKEAGVSDSELVACIQKTDKEFNVSKDFDNKEKWNGRFPPFGVDAELAKKYAVSGSPTLVVNGVVAKVGRSPKDILEAVCKAFKERPAECDKQLDSTTPTPGFGFGKGSDTKAPEASCGS